MACVLSADDRRAEHPEESTLTAFLLKTHSEACDATGLYLRKPRHRNTEKGKNYLGPDPTTGITISGESEQPEGKTVSE